MKMQRHPLLAAFPSMSKPELAELTKSIKQFGQRDPGVVLDGMVIDGWNRYLACIELGIQCKFTELPRDVDPVNFVIDKNARRCNMTAAQKAQAIVTCRSWAPEGRPSKSAAAAGLMTAAQMAKEAGVGKRTIAQAKTAQRIGVEDLVRDGKLSGDEVDELAKMSEPKRAQVVEHIKAGGKAPKKQRQKKATDASDSEGKQARVDAKVQANTALQDTIEALTDQLQDAITDRDQYRGILNEKDKLRAALDEASRQKGRARIAEALANALSREKEMMARKIRALQSELKMYQGKGGAVGLVQCTAKEPLTQRQSNDFQGGLQ